MSLPPDDSPDSLDESIDVDAEEAPESLRGARKLLVVGGGRGGVGKSMVAQNLAVYFAQLGKSVVLVDADPTGANVHAQFALRAATQEPELDVTGYQSFERALVQTSVPGLKLLPAAHDAIIAPPALRAGRKARWLARLRSLPADYLVIDVGPGIGPLAVDLMLAADMPLAVCVPEPPAIETTFRFLRAAYRRRVRRLLGKDRFYVTMLDRALTEIGELARPVELVRALAKMDTKVAELAWTEAARLRMFLVVNQTRVRADAELGAFLCALSKRHYGINLEELGHVENDDSVWLAVRRKKPLLVDSPASKAARNLERIARRVVALTTSRDHRGTIPPPLPLEAPTLYTVLGTTRTSSDEEVRRAYKRQREVYALDGLAAASIFDEETLKRELFRLDEAYDTLLDPVRRRAYDLSTFPDADDDRAPAIPRPALAAEQLMLQSELIREIGPDTEFTGALLRKVRESQGVEIAEIAARTKIARSHLEAIEEETYASLPALVYVRGFVLEVAKYLRLDSAQVQRTYLRRMREKADA